MAAHTKPVIPSFSPSWFTTTKDKPTDLEACFASMERLTYEEIEHAVTLAAKYGKLVDFTQKLTEVVQRKLAHGQLLDCYLWGQACFEVGLDYGTGKPLTREQVAQRLKDSQVQLRTIKRERHKHPKTDTYDNRLYWEHEVIICRNMLKHASFLPRPKPAHGN